MLKSKFLVPALAVLIVLLYVPHAATSAQRGAHKVGVFLTSAGRGLSHFLDSVTS
jgi:hypothetical protein